jgi:tRNA-splicing ligase RtcB
MTGQMLNSKLRSYASIVEPDTLAQAYQTAALDVVWPYMALMPDAHLGKGATVGSVVPTRRAICPAVVGVDIGCGMDALMLDIKSTDLGGTRALADLRRAIENAVPLSAGRYNSRVISSARSKVIELEGMDGAESAEKVSPNWRLQLGSLGSGNHFIEVSLDAHGGVWLFLHSGSRGVGNKLAQQHIRIAQDTCKAALPNRDLAYLVEDSDEFINYIADLRWAQEFARLNRAEMMDRVYAQFIEWIGHPVNVVHRVSCHHNYTVQETIQGEKVWLSRKGAIDAHEGVQGLIPGSMGAASYVVEGLGNADGLFSAPHGAGRMMSRSKAKRAFDMDDLTARMDGIEWRHTDAFLDEHPLAYKDIDVVMADAAELVKTRYLLHQIVNVKGD